MKTRIGMRQLEGEIWLKRAKYGLGAASLVAMLGIVIFGFAPKSSTEVSATVLTFTTRESETGTYLKVVFETEQGDRGQVSIPRGYPLKRGDKILCLEMETHIGTKRYRFLRRANET